MLLCLSIVLALALTTLTSCKKNNKNTYDDDEEDITDKDNNKEQNGTLNTEEVDDDNDDDEDFVFDENNYPQSANDAIAQSLMNAIKGKNTVLTTQPKQYDGLYYCYYATDSMGNVFFSGKMDAANSTFVQLGLSSLNGLDKVVSDTILGMDNIADYLYSTNTVPTVGDRDVITVSYTKTWMDGETEKSETVNNHYYVVSNTDYNSSKEFSKFLIGKQVGTELGDVTVNEVVGEKTKAYAYKNVRVESIVKDNSTDKVESGDKVFVTYTFKFDAKTWYNAETKEYNFPEAHKYLDKSNIDEEGFYKQTITLEFNVATADVTLPDSATAEEKAAAKTFLGQLVGMEINSTAKSFTIEKDQTILKDQTVKVDYSNVKVNWVVNSEMKSISFAYTLYPEALNADLSNKKTERSTIGQKVILNEVELYFYVFPTYCVDVPDITTENILREFTTTATSYKQKINGKVFLFDTFNDTTFKYGDRTVYELAYELYKLNKTLNECESTLNKALKELKNTQLNLATYNGYSTDEFASLMQKKDVAYSTYMSAKEKYDLALENVQAKIAEILSATNDTKDSIADCLMSDCEEYVTSLLANRE